MESILIRGLVERENPGIVVQIPRERRVFVDVSSARLLEILNFFHTQGATHLSTITVVDLLNEGRFEILYHLFWESNEISVRTVIERENPVVPTVTGIFPGALTYEREIQDMFGIRVDGIPSSKRLLISDDWPADQYPLRKDYEGKCA